MSGVLELVASIKHMPGGYVVEARSPYGSKIAGCGPVICRTLDDVFDLLLRCDVDPERRAEGAER